MSHSTRHLDTLMENASKALAVREYLACEALCLEALALARQKHDWGYYARILLPLQEARRHRRTLAAEGFIRLGVAFEDGSTLEKALPDQPFCLVLTQPSAATLAQSIHLFCRREFRYAQIFWADQAPQKTTWLIRSFAGTHVTVERPAPPLAWQNRWISPLDKVPTDPQHPSLTPGDWVIDAGEALGDAALAGVKSPLGTLERLEELEACLEAMSDHEILHQRLAQAALSLATR